MTTFPLKQPLYKFPFYQVFPIYRWLQRPRRPGPSLSRSPWAPASRAPTSTWTGSCGMRPKEVSWSEWVTSWVYIVSYKTMGEVNSVGE